MTYSANRLPSRFPEGTKFVVEGRRGRSGAQVFSRFIEFPDGTCLALPSKPDAKSPAAPRRSRSRRRA